MSISSQKWFDSVSVTQDSSCLKGNKGNICSQHSSPWRGYKDMAVVYEVK